MKKDNKISAIILFAGEKSVVNAISSVEFCNEIIIIHDCSSGEKNLAIIPKNISKQKTIHKKLTSFSDQRNFGLEQAIGDWILYIDADEVISIELKEEILKKTEKENINGYYLRRIDEFVGKKISKGELLNIYLLRLARRKTGKWSGVVHEKWNIKGDVGKLGNPIIHFPHPSLSEFLSEINKYTELRSSELHKARVNSNVFSIVLYPTVKFLINYVLKMGFLEGNRGFVLSMTMSFHSFLVRSKLYHSAHASVSD